MCLIMKFKYGYKVIILIYMVKWILVYGYSLYITYFSVIEV